MVFSGKVGGNWPMNKRLHFGGDTGSPSGYRDCFSDWSLFGNTVSTDCAARRCSAGHAPADIAIATMTSLRHRPTTDSGNDIATLVRRALAEVCTVAVFLVYKFISEPCRKAKGFGEATGKRYIAATS